MTNVNTSGLDQLRFLIGRWQGHSEGFGQRSEVEHTYRYILNNQFIQSKTKSTTYAEDGSIKEIHEDLGVYSYDVSREKIILRGFYSEGYVNVYVMEDRTGDGSLMVLYPKKRKMPVERWPGSSWKSSRKPNMK